MYTSGCHSLGKGSGTIHTRFDGALPVVCLPHVRVTVRTGVSVPPVALQIDSLDAFWHTHVQPTLHLVFIQGSFRSRLLFIFSIVQLKCFLPILATFHLV